MKKNIISLFVIILSVSSVYGQQLLTVEDALAIALNQSTAIKQASYTLQAAERNLRAYKLGLYTSLDMEFDLPDYDRSISSRFNPDTGVEEFYETGQTKVEGRVTLSQPLLFSNGNISLVGQVYGREQLRPNDMTTRDYYSNFIVRFRQPLLKFNTLLADLERTEIRFTKSERDYNQAENDLVFRVKSAFFNLLKQKESVNIAKEKVKQTEESYNTANNKYKAGLIAEVDALQLEVDLASGKNELLNAERLYEEQKNSFKLLIGIPLDEDFGITAEVGFEPIEPDLNKAIEYAMANRHEIMNIKDDIFLREMDVDEVGADRTVSADISASYGINKNDDEFRNVFEDFRDNRSVTLTLNVPIYDWGQNSNLVEAAEIEVKKKELEHQQLLLNIRNEIISSVNKIQSAKARVEVLQKSVELAQKSYEISVNRFSAGTITSFEFAQVQIRLNDAKLSALAAVIDYKIAVAELEKLTLHNYQN